MSDSILIDDELFAEMKILFLAGNRDTIANIIKATEQGQMTDAHRLVHTLKSSAMLIGKTQLGNISHIAEGMLKSGTKLPQELLSTLEAELTKVLDELQIQQTI